jgi:asparagine synthetase B (glutamine-hydrolysing)
MNPRAPAADATGGVAVCVDLSAGGHRVSFHLPELPGPRIVCTVDRPAERSAVILGNAATEPGLPAAILSGDETRLRSLPAVSAALLWDGRAGTLTAVTDRVGNLGLYYGRSGDRLVVADSAARAAGLLCQAIRFDVEAAAEIAWLGFPLSENTLFGGVGRVPAASIWRFTSSGVARSTYWRPEFCPGSDRAVDRALDALVSAVSRATSGGRTAIALSGVIDTRAILAAALSLRQAGDGFTSGLARSADVRVARMLARHLGGRWHCLAIDGAFLDQFDRWAEAAVTGSGGTLGVENAHLAYLNRLLPAKTDALADGGGAEAAKRGLLHRAVQSARSKADLARLLLHDFGHPASAEALLGAGAMKRTAERLGTLLEDLVRDVDQATIGDTLDAFFLRHMWTSYHGSGVALQNEHVGCRLPFLDNGFLDTLMQVPVAARARSDLNFLTVRHRAPELERYPRVWMDVAVPWSSRRVLTMIPPPVARAAHRLLNRPAFPIGRWMRHELREQCAAAVLSFVERGVTDCGVLKAALARGEPPITGSLGRAARTAWRFEIWLRAFSDRPTDTSRRTAYLK